MNAASKRYNGKTLKENDKKSRECKTKLMFFNLDHRELDVDYRAEFRSLGFLNAYKLFDGNISTTAERGLVGSCQLRSSDRRFGTRNFRIAQEIKTVRHIRNDEAVKHSDPRPVIAKDHNDLYKPTTGNRGGKSRKKENLKPTIAENQEEPIKPPTIKRTRSSMKKMINSRHFCYFFHSLSN
ncbi:unnamed protein product [Caenorhabditis sp. 36 PRJEB53466]|nr:unnamed protein product [Caenorhabditis sp. 36 PRJEB53466]